MHQLYFCYGVVEMLRGSFFLNTEQRKFQGQQNMLEKAISSEINFRK